MMVAVSYNRLRTMRKLKGFSSAEKLAEASGVSKNHISNIEAGKVDPSVRIICKLSKVLSCKPEDLFECKEEE
jgi:transcriptional regulator with XRE-family HTH domain